VGKLALAKKIEGVSLRMEKNCDDTTKARSIENRKPQ
jgi:hypothetical protein